MFRFENFLEQLEQQYDNAQLPVKIRDSFEIKIGQGKISFFVHPTQTNREVQQKLAEIASNSFGCWLNTASF